MRFLLGVCTVWVLPPCAPDTESKIIYTFANVMAAPVRIILIIIYKNVNEYRRRWVRLRRRRRLRQRWRLERWLERRRRRRRQPRRLYTRDLCRAYRSARGAHILSSAARKKNAWLYIICCIAFACILNSVFAQRPRRIQWALTRCVFLFFLRFRQRNEAKLRTKKWAKNWNKLNSKCGTADVHTTTTTGSTSARAPAYFYLFILIFEFFAGDAPNNLKQNSRNPYCCDFACACVCAPLSCIAAVCDSTSILCDCCQPAALFWRY